jgi:hypothetical protein
MKVNLKHIVGLAVLGMTLFANTAPTWAGAVAHSEVVINPTTSYPNETHAYGSLVGARYSADGRQYIGCSLDTALRVQCAAQDSANKYAYCYSYDAGHVNAVQKMTDSSTISFRFNRTNATCVMIAITDDSRGLK